MKGLHSLPSWGFTTMYLGLALRFPTRPVTCWIPSPVNPFARHGITRNLSPIRPLRKSVINRQGSARILENENIIEAVASSGVNDEELSAIMESITRVCQEEGISFGRKFLLSFPSPCIPLSVPSAMGRAVVLSTILSEEDIWELQCAVAEQMDHLLYSEAPSLHQPVLIIMRNDSRQLQQENCIGYITSLIEEQVQQHELALPIPRNKPPSGISFLPSLHLELDGAYIADDRDSTTSWDTSTLLVFDGLVSDELRRSLLDLVRGAARVDHSSTWNDVLNGPDPSRWMRGGLLDIPKADQEETADTDSDNEGPCWGLRDEAVDEICFQHHNAIHDFENILSALFPDFIVSRLPEAVFGSSVSPLTANAPACGDEFNYHIDGDPNLAPPSPWTDIYGRYPNRIKGKPRFMSCLIYLNDVWDGQQWGAPTRFLDVPTDKFYDVEPRPGRCVFMDQDVSHTVVAPKKAAGKRPRYSIVWKLILHPKVFNQDVTNLCGKRKSDWPDTVLFGSADRVRNS